MVETLETTQAQDCAGHRMATRDTEGDAKHGRIVGRRRFSGGLGESGGGGYGGVGGGVGGKVGDVGGDVAGVIWIVDRGVRVFACQSITGFFHSRYGMPRISDCAPNEATKKIPVYGTPAMVQDKDT